MERTVARRYIVRGRVQGVGFRAFVTEIADAFGVSGWVQNNHDGSVEVFVQGTESVLPAFTEQIEIGSSVSRVDSLDIEETEPDSGLQGFSVRR